MKSEYSFAIPFARREGETAGRTDGGGEPEKAQQQSCTLGNESVLELWPRCQEIRERSPPFVVWVMIYSSRM